MALFNGDLTTQMAAHRSNAAVKRLNTLDHLMVGDRRRVENAMASLQGMIDGNYREAQAARAEKAKVEAGIATLAATRPAREAALATARAVLSRAESERARAVEVLRKVERNGREGPGAVAEARADAVRREADAAGGKAAVHRLISVLETVAPDHPLLRRDGDGGFAIVAAGRAAYVEAATRHGLVVPPPAPTEGACT